MDKKIKVLHVISSVSVGGVESLVSSMLEHIDRDKFSIDLAVFNPNNPVYQEHLEDLGFRVYFISDAGCNTSITSKIAWRIKAIWNFYILLGKYNYDVIHLHNYEEYRFYLFLSFLKNVKVRIVHSHNAGGINVECKNSFIRKIKYFFRLNWLITHKVGCSKMAADWLYGKNTDSKVIYNGVNLEKFTNNSFDRNEVRIKYGLKSELVFLSVARFNVQKNHGFILDIFNEISQKKDDVFLILVGFGHLEKKIRKKVDSMKLSNKVLFLPFDVEIPALLKGVDFFLLPSLWEGLPITAIESQAAGIPIFMSNTITREVDTGLAVYLSLDLEAEQWATFILEFNKDMLCLDKARLSMFDIKSVVKKFEKIYKVED